MKRFLTLLFLPWLSYAQTSMDIHRWYLNPTNQEILISIDDLHDETILASPEMDWGRSFVPSIVLKKDIVIAIIDGGIEIEHPELKNHIAYNSDECHDGTIIPPKGEVDKDDNGYKGDCAGWDFVQDHNRPEDMDGHGTHVTGVIRSVMQGVQGNFKFLPLKVFAPDEGRQTVKSSAPLSVRLKKAFEYALSRKVDVIHLSVGWPKSFMTYELEQTIKKVMANGIIVVAAAGNSSQRATIYPCQMEGVICVGALRPNGEVARFSNWGSQVDLFAPGEKILSTIPHRLAPMHISRKGYDFKNGTSQAAPFISAAMGLLKGAFINESTDALYARLMSTANKAEGDKGLKGLFKLDSAFQSAASAFVFPQLKGLHAVVVENDGTFSIDLPLKNYWQKTRNEVEVTLTCKEAFIHNNFQTLPLLVQGQSHLLLFKGKMTRENDFLHCELKVDEQQLSLRLKLLHKLKRPFKSVVVNQDELLVIKTRTGARSRFMTLTAIQGTVPGPFYYIAGDKDLIIYKEDKILGSLEMKKDCSFLRVWQIDLNGDAKNELMIESICDKTHLLYQFLDMDLNEMYPGVKYRPGLTIVNYDDFEVIPQSGLPPIFRFMNIGFNIPSDSPWDSDVASQANHYYELYPVKAADEWKFEVKVLEDPEEWVKSLKLRYLPSYQVIHHINGKLLIKLGQKTAWIDVKTQKASWANLDDLLLTGGQKQKLHGTDEFILQSFLTPFEYRGFVMKGVKLRFKQENKFDPVLDILGTQVNDKGYLTILRSFQKLIFLQYNFSGEMISQFEKTIDRFDFLTAQDLIASVVNLVTQGEMIQLVDGTKVNTNYVDIFRGGEMVSYEIPSECVTQQPVVIDERPTLPIFCAKSRSEFEMRFIEL